VAGEASRVGVEVLCKGGTVSDKESGTGLVSGPGAPLGVVGEPTAKASTEGQIRWVPMFAGLVLKEELGKCVLPRSPRVGLGLSGPEETAAGWKRMALPGLGEETGPVGVTKLSEQLDLQVEPAVV
jgi:hypothetical protein